MLVETSVELSRQALYLPKRSAVPKLLKHPLKFTKRQLKETPYFVVRTSVVRLSCILLGTAAVMFDLKKLKFKSAPSEACPSVRGWSNLRWVVGFPQLIRAWLPVLFLMWLQMCPAACGQDQILSRLPRREAIYLWVDDAPALLARLHEVAEENTTPQQLWELAESQRAEDASPTNVVPLLNRLRLLSELWTQLYDQQLFDGQVVLILPVDASSVQDPGFNDKRVFPHVSSFTLVAHTQSSQDDFATFFNTLAKLNSNAGRDETPRDEEVSTDAGVPGHWAVDGEWFCWSADELETVSTLDHLSGQQLADQTLAADRSFRTVTQHLKSQLASDHQLAFYVTDEALPLLAWYSGEAVSLTNSVRNLSWRELFLDELRGFGGRLYLGSESFEQQLRAPLALDAFLLMTQPRRGVLGAVGDRESHGIEFDFPTLTTPIERFAQIVISGEKLSDGVAEISTRTIELDPDQKQPEEDPRENPAIQLLSSVSRITELTFAPRDSDSADDPYARNLVLAKISEIGRFAELFTMASNGNLQLRDSLPADSPLSSLPNEELEILGQSDQSIQNQLDQTLSVIANVEKQIRQLVDSGAPDVQRQIAAKRQRIQNLQQRLQDIEESRHQPSLVFLNNWLVVWNVTQEENQQELVDTYGESSPQLVELEAEIGDMKDAFANRESLCGVVAFWTSHLINRGEIYFRRERFQSPQEDSTGEIASDVSSDQFLINQVRQQLDKLLITLSSNDDGFRINAALLQRNFADDLPQ